MAFSLSALDDGLVACVSSYGAPEDLLNLALTCRRLGSKRGAATGREWRQIVRDAKRQKSSVREWSLMDEVARGVVDEIATLEKKACVPLREGECWTSRYNELLLLRRPLTFDIAMNHNIELSEDSTEVFVGEDPSHEVTICHALCRHIMRAGKHYASFTMTSTDNGILAGVYRPVKEVHEGVLYESGVLYQSAEWAENGVNECLFGFENTCAWKIGSIPSYEDNWQEGGEMQNNDVAGLLLDLDDGTLTVYKNGRRLGVLRDDLSGEYCWGVDMSHWHDASVKISRGSVPSE